MKEKLVLNEDFGFNLGDTTIASYSLGTGIINILKGHGSHRMAMIKQLKDADMVVNTHKMVDDLDQRPEVDKMPKGPDPDSPPPRKVPETSKPTPGKGKRKMEPPKKVAPKKGEKAAPPPPEEEEEVAPHKDPEAVESKVLAVNEETDREKELKEREMNLAMRERKLAEKEAALGMAEREEKPDIYEFQDDWKPAADLQGIELKKWCSAWGPQTRPDLGDKDPWMIEFCKLNLTEEQFYDIYGHRKFE